MPVLRDLEKRRERLDRLAAAADSAPRRAMLEHVVALDEEMIGRLGAPSGKGHSRRAAMIRWYLGTGLRMPGPPGLVFPTDGELDGLITRIAATDLAFRERLGEIAEDDVVTTHPVFGRMSASDVASLTAVHAAYHVRHAPFRLPS